MTFKRFDYKGQMVNYYNKMRENKKITFMMKYFDCQTGKYTIAYEF